MKQYISTTACILLFIGCISNSYSAPPPWGYEDETPYLNYNRSLSIIGNSKDKNKKFTQPGSPLLENDQIYVPDCGGQRIQIYTTKGIYLNSISHPEWVCPKALHRDQQGRLWVLDQATHRIYWLSNNTVIGEIGGFGNQIGRFNNPMSFILSKTQLYVADTYNHRIQIFKLDKDGLPVETSIQVIRSAFNKSFNQPQAIALSNDNQLYITDTYNHRIVILDANLNPYKKWGRLGSFKFEFHQPSDISIVDDLIMIADNLNHRIQFINQEGRFAAQWGYHPRHDHEGKDHIHFPTFIGANRDTVGICDPEEHLCYTLSRQKALNEERPVDSWDKLISYHPLRRTLLTDKHLAISEPDQHRILLYNSNELTGTNQSLKPIITYGNYGDGSSPNQFNTPTSIAYSSNNKIWYVADTGNQRIIKLQQNEKNLEYIGEYGNENIIPTTLLVDNSGSLLVVDQHLQAIVVLNADLNKELTRYSLHQQNSNQTSHITDLAISATGSKLYFTDHFNNRIQLLNIVRDKENNIQSIKLAKTQTTIENPWEIINDGSNRFVVSQLHTNTIILYSSELGVMSSYPAPVNPAEDRINTPRALSAWNNLLVTMNANDHVLNVLFSEGFYLKSYGTGDFSRFDIFLNRWVKNKDL